MVTLDMSDDYLYLDGLADVVYLPAGTSQRLSVSNAHKSFVTKREVLESNGSLTSRDCHFILSQKMMTNGTLKPIQRSTIEEVDGTQWTILEAWYNQHSQIWDCLCRNFVAESALVDTFDIEAANESVATDGTIQESWSAITGGKDLQGRIQPMGATMASDFGAENLDVMYEIRLMQDFDVDSSNRVKDSNGKIYEIKGYKKRESIYDLMTILARESAWVS